MERTPDDLSLIYDELMHVKALQYLSTMVRILFSSWSTACDKNSRRFRFTLQLICVVSLSYMSFLTHILFIVRLKKNCHTLLCWNPVSKRELCVSV